jgi:hypothetical protein
MCTPDDEIKSLLCIDSCARFVDFFCVGATERCCATEPSSRTALHNSVFGGYFKALAAMHGWSDGDGYYANYLCHPIQGAASGYWWIDHDPVTAHLSSAWAEIIG